MKKEKERGSRTLEHRRQENQATGGRTGSPQEIGLSTTELTPRH
jgi:hypothetical protein